MAELEAAKIRASGPWRAQCLPLDILDGERRSEENDEEVGGVHGWSEARAAATAHEARAGSGFSGAKKQDLEFLGRER